MCHCGARFKFLVLSFKQRSVLWDNLLILNPQHHIHKRCQQFFGQITLTNKDMSDSKISIKVGIVEFYN